MLWSNERNVEEIKIIKNLKHPNIVTPIEFCRDKDLLYLVTEYCDGGTLYDKIIRMRKISEDICKDYIK